MAVYDINRILVPFEPGVRAKTPELRVRLG